MSKLVEQFLKLKPPKFDGKGDLEAAPRWVEELEKAFEVLGCTEVERVTLAYFSESARERKLAEFMRLRQGLMTVDQYEAKFARLSKFAPRMVEDPQDKVRRFRDGLKPDLRSQMISLNIKDYGEMYEQAQAIERDQVDRAVASGSRFASARDNCRFGKKLMAGNRRFVPLVRKNIRKPNHQQNRFGACFKCGSLDHRIRNCPQQRPSGPPVQAQQPRVGNQIGNPPPAVQGRPPAQGRVYAMVRREAKDTPGMVTGTVSLCDHAAYALFDPRATYSFISEQFVRLIGIELVMLEVMLYVTTPLNDKVLVSLGCPSCKLIIGGREEMIDLADLTMFDFDVIIGID
ncbi:uncharacterized protein LOC115663728 [Syzygium oleosum]|uniref:uncharacterized protein LOC115663728 n=1 Tax=Syzygium oleosum TaxID=219896 RepID=UPI0024BB2A04|nr:uncharacterized protein LOC115663728 [Syzygium oleosum]